MGSSSGEVQTVATVYIDAVEYRVVAPPRAKGNPLDWADQLRVRHYDQEGCEVEIINSYTVLARKIAIEELQKTKSSPDGSSDTPQNYYHVRLELSDGERFEVKFDLTRSELEQRVLEPYRNLSPIVLNGRTIVIETIKRIEIFEAMGPSSELDALMASLGRQGVVDWFHGETRVRDVTDEFIVTPSVDTIPQRSEAIELICARFHTVARQLRERHSNKPTLDVEDEYDVQDLLHALLRIFFDDVRKEEWTPSYAGKSSRVDFLLPSEEVVVEAKKTRPGLGAKELGDQLIIDIARYRVHPQCKRLICFVYDPDGRVNNPRGIEQDLSRNDGELDVSVFIAPRAD